ncbi:MAG: entericidin A/B family lipoprotein [Candidatus Hydrogenedentes bacterium]|nr:entericidin A/B family lipoprotein [Candidatus Hydrogenedentota bacterium]
MKSRRPYSTALCVPVIALLCLFGCNTIHGAGRDIKSGGKAIEKTFSGSKAAPGTQSGQLTITSKAGKGGLISPSGSVAVPAGAEQLFTIKADPGYATEDVVVDGKSIGPASGYRFVAVQADHTISVEFAPNPAR